MLRSLLSAVSGLKNHQVRMDVIGNNVSNVNTVAFKAGRATFKEGFSQMLQAATGPTDTRGGINPIQVGTGMNLGTIDTIFNQGNFETTGVKTDLAIQGSSFFVVAKGNQQLFTRAGNFQLDSDGMLVHPSTGYVVQGRQAIDGEIQDGIVNIQIPFGQKTAAKASTEMTMAGNLNAEALVGDTASSSLTVYDSLGAKHELEITYTKTAANSWNYAVTCGTATVSAGGTGTAVFEADGTLDLDAATPGSAFPDITLAPLTSGGGSFSVALDAGDGTINGLTQFKGNSTPVLRDQDGYPMGDLLDFAIDKTGTITGAFSNGRTVTLGQLVLADFNNPSGLNKTGDNMYTTSENSGNAVLGYSGEASQSTVSAGGLEMSNVDLAAEFTSMIVAQRGFQASGRVITSSDEMLQELVNLKR